MTNIEAYKSRLTKVSKDIFENFENTGEDDMFYLGQVASGEVHATLPNLIHRAQVFADADFRGRVGSAKSFTSMGISVVGGVLDGSIKGLVNNGFTSFVVANKTIGLTELKETFASKQSKSFALTNLGYDISDIEQRLNNIARNIQVPAKKSIFSKSKTVPFEITKKQSSNSFVVLMDEIYQIAEKRIGEGFDTELERSTAAILATWLVSRAMDLSVGGKDPERKLDEAMKLQFYTHLNGCFNNGNCEISKIIKNGTNLALALIQELGYGIDDIQAKYERLDMPLKDNPTSLREALFGRKYVAESIMNVVDEEIISREPDMIYSIEESSRDFEAGIARVDEMTEAARRIMPSVSSTIIGGGGVPLLDERTETKHEDVEDVEEVIDERDETSPESATDEFGVIAGVGEVAHKKGNAVNYTTLREGIMDSISADIHKKYSNLTNKADKTKKEDKKEQIIKEMNFLCGADDAIRGIAKQSNREDSYYEGYSRGELERNLIVNKVDEIYSKDKKTLLIKVDATGSAATSQLKNHIAKKWRGYESFKEMRENILRDLSFVFHSLYPEKKKDEHSR